MRKYYNPKKFKELNLKEGIKYGYYIKILNLDN